MKRYEKLSKEEIIAYFRSIDKGCDGCIVFENKGREYDCNNCIREISIVLNEEIEMVPRAWTFKTAEEAEIMWNNHKCPGFCGDCKYSAQNSKTTNCRINWLYELVEKPKEEEKI